MEETKGDDNTFSILLAVQVSAGLAIAGYCGYPTILYLLEGVFLWFDWFRLVLRNIFLIFIFINALIVSIYFLFRKTTPKKNPSLYDEYITPVPSVVSHPPQPSFAPTEICDYGGCGYYNNSSCIDSVKSFQAVVNTVEESTSCYEQVVMETTSSKSYKKTVRLEKKKKKIRSSTVEYQSVESERVMKTESLVSLEMMNGLSNDEFRMTVDSFLMEKKRICGWQNYVADHSQNGVVGQWQNGVPQLQYGMADHWQNGFPQLQNGEVDQWQNGGVDQWQNGFPQLQNGGFDQWQNSVPQLQNGGFDQWQNSVPQLQGQHDYGGTGRHRHRSRRRQGGPGSTSSRGPYLAISN